MTSVQRATMVDGGHQVIVEVFEFENGWDIYFPPIFLVTIAESFELHKKNARWTNYFLCLCRSL